MEGPIVLVHEWVTGGGLAGSELPPSWAAEGAAMRRAIAADFASLAGIRVVMTLDPRLPDEPGPWTSVRIGPGREPDELARLAGRADWTVLVAPETGGILADRTRILERSGGRSLGSAAAAVELTGDKLALGAWLTSKGIATPECRRVVPSDGLPEDFPYPAVLKPIDGAGALDTFWIGGAAELPEEARALTAALLQPFVSGTPMSASYLVGPGGGAELVGVGRQRVERRGSRFVYEGGVLPVSLGQAESQVRHAVESVPGLRGFVGVDFVHEWPKQIITILEINPRPTTSYVGLARLLRPGQLARRWIDAAEGTWSEVAASERLAGIVHSQPPLTFEPDGAIRRERDGGQS